MALFATAVLYDVVSVRPTDNAITTEGRLFFATDEGKIYRDNGTTWDNMAIGGGIYQPLDADLTAIAGLTRTDGKFIVSRSGAWAVDTLLAADLPAMVGDSGAGGTKGAVPAPAAGDAAANKYLKADGTWAAPSGSIGGSTGATDEQVLVADGTGGATLKATPVTIDSATGNANFLDAIVQRAKFKDSAETLVTVASSGAAYTVNLENGNVVDLTLTADCTLTLSNPPATGNAGSFTLIVRQDGTGGWGITWPGSVNWLGGTPAPDTTAGGTAFYVLTTVDAGTTWWGALAGDDSGALPEALPNFGAGATKTLATDVGAAGADRHLVLNAETGSTDNLIEITGLAVGDEVILRAAAGDTITVKHNDAGATDKILLYNAADFALSGDITLKLIKIAAGKVVQYVDDAGAGGSGATVLSDQTRGSDGSFSTVSGIAAGYSRITIQLIDARINTADAVGSVQGTFNADTTDGNYQWELLYHQNTTVGASGGASRRFANACTNNAPTDAVSNVECLLDGYDNAHIKSLSFHSNEYRSAGTFYDFVGTFWWIATAAITSILIDGCNSTGTVVGFKTGARLLVLGWA